MFCCCFCSYKGTRLGWTPLTIYHARCLQCVLSLSLSLFLSLSLSLLFISLSLSLSLSLALSLSLSLSLSSLSLSVSSLSFNVSLSASCCPPSPFISLSSRTISFSRSLSLFIFPRLSASFPLSRYSDRKQRSPAFWWEWLLPSHQNNHLKFGDQGTTPSREPPWF